MKSGGESFGGLMRVTLSKLVIGCAVAALIPLGQGSAAASVSAPAEPSGPGKKSEWTKIARPDQKRLAALIGDAIPSNPYCRRSLDRLELFRNSSDFVWPSSLTILSETRDVDINALDLFVGPFQDPSRRLWFRSLLWLAWRATSFAEAGQTAEATAAGEALVKAADGYPDPGSSTEELLALANTSGWDEGTATRRAEALLCATSAVPVAKLEPSLRAHAAALIDPARYIGPPNRQVHNHGLLANLTLLDIADVLNDTAIRDIAVSRLRSEYPLVFSPSGFSSEAASHYHGVNYLGWTEAMYALQQRGLTAEVAGIQEMLGRAANVSAHFIGPTGVPLMLGNSRGDDGFLRPGGNGGRPLMISDPAAGVAFGRQSWSDQNTTAWSAMNRPRRGAHGHDDRLSVTWQTGGAPVLIDPGQPDYELANPFTAWAKSAEAHNTSVVTKTKKDRIRETSLAVERTGGLDKISMSSTHSGFPQEREVLIDHNRRSMWVSDTAQSSQAQHWHFAPEWTVSGITGNVATLTDTQGRTVTVTTTKGATIQAYSGSTSPAAGWYATGFETVIPATELIITGKKTLDTLFVMGNGTPPEDVRVLKTSAPASKKVTLQWSAPVEPEPKKGKKGKKKQRRAAVVDPNPAAKITGYRIQMKSGSEQWKTITEDTGSAEAAATIPGLTNGTPYRFRVAALAKGTQTAFSRPSGKMIPFTKPGPVTLELAVAKGSVKKPKVKLGWAPPVRTGGAPTTGYEILVPEQKIKKGRKQQPREPQWKAISGLSTKVLMLQKRMVVQLRAVNKGGSGKALRVLLVRKKNGKLLANGQDLAPVPTIPTPTPTPTPSPVPTPGVPTPGVPAPDPAQPVAPTG